MQKKLIVTLALAVMFVLLFTVSVFAGEIHNENTVDYSAKVTLSDGTEVALFDSEGNALIWYLDGSGALQSIRADDQRVKWYTETWDEVTATSITLDDGTKYDVGKYVVVNLMDDDVVKNYGPGEKYYGKPMTGFKYVFQGAKNLEYAYLRLDTTSIMRQSFNGCSKLKYVNLADLNKVTRIGDSQHFSNCSLLFKDQVVDLSGMTSLKRIDGGGTFNNVHFSKIIFPSSLTEIGSWTFQATSIQSFIWPSTVTKMEGSMFKNNTGLKEIYLSDTLTSIGENAFLNVNTLEKIFYVGSKDEFITLLASVNTTGNTPFFNVVGENNANLISYADYKKLADKSGKYVIYDVDVCVYNDGAHGEINAVNSCVGSCSICGEVIVNHIENDNMSVSITHTSYGVAGTKTTACKNEGCAYCVSEETSALVVCLGYSSPEDGGNSIAIGFSINKDAIGEFEKISGKKFEFGVFAVLKDKLGSNDVLDTSGNLTCAGIKADIEIDAYVSVELKISGFDTEEQQALKLAIGVYTEVSDDEAAEYSYIQAGNANDGEKYVFVSYSDINQA